MALPQERRYTLEDVMAWDESERVELIDGLPVAHATPVRKHQRILLKIAKQLEDYLEDKTCEVNIAPFCVRLFEEKDDRPGSVDTVVEPDITVVCDPDKLDDIGCKGAPDMVAEILSPSTRQHDRLVKYDLYERAGVREYWIVDPDTETVQVYQLEEGHYHAAQVYTRQSKVKVEVLEDCFIDLDRVFG